MTILHYHKATNPRIKGYYEISNDRVDEAKAWLLENGYMIFSERAV